LRRLVRAGPESDPTSRAYARDMARIYGAIHDHTGGAVIVDSSNLPGYGMLLGAVGGIDLCVLHLVRDPRGVAHSWNRTRVRDDRGSGAAHMGREGLVKSSLLWNLWNRTTEACWGADPSRYVRVRYEDVVADPRRALEPVMRMLGMPGDAVPAARDGVVQMDVCHTVAGNPIRTIAGRVRLTADNEWITSMPRARRAAVAVLTGPRLARYGYPWRATGRRDTASAKHGAHPEARVFIEDMHGAARFRARVARNVRWIRNEGISRVLEEKEVAPARNTAAAVGKWRYRRGARVDPGTAVPVFVFGLQRSGTNMLMRGIGAAPETEVHNENDPRAFDRFKLRPLPVVQSIVQASRHSHVIFKPLCDSHRADELLDGLHSTSAPRAVWAYRDVEGRVRSALAKFGDGNLQVLREFADGTNVGRWHVQRMSAETAAFVRSFDFDTLTAASGAALMWLVRNQLYFDLGLDRRPEVLLVSYNAFVAEPAETMRELCEFLGFPYRAALVKHVTPRRSTYRDALDVDPRIAQHCAALARRLDSASRRAGAATRP
jgi:hypothetical protein